MPDELTPTTNIEKFLAKTAGESVELPEPATRIEKYLNKIASEQTITEATDNWLDEHIDPSTGYVLDSTLTLDNAAPPASSVGDLKSALNSVVESYADLSQYLYAKDTYMSDNTGTLATISGFDLYKIPIGEKDIVYFNSSVNFAQGMTAGFIWHLQKSDETFVSVAYGTGQYDYLIPANIKGQNIILGGNGIRNVYVSVKRDLLDNITFGINKADNVIRTNKVSGITVFDKNSDLTNLCISQIYKVPSTNKFSSISGNYYAINLKVSAGDRFIFNGSLSGIGYYGCWYNGTDSGSIQINKTVTEYTVENDGYFDFFINTEQDASVIYHPVDTVKILSTDVIADKSNDNIFNQFSGLNGVAFGTSLTSRSTSSYGYLTQLSLLSGITFDNQGVGSSVILGDGGDYDMLAKIKGYSGYTGKRVCVLEGFVNDWYQNKAIGTYTDTAETTVCGCVRSALNYMLSQNANLTIFLILDHFGRNYSSIDCSTTATRGAGLTQYEYYEEIAKVAESLGITVIKEYAISQISENTPQYLADNIHLNALGAVQSGNVIWNKMRQFPANAV